MKEMRAMNYSIIEIKTFYGDNKSEGKLSVFEAERDVPFAFKRFYYICGVEEGIKRGAHAHKELRQLLFCPYGEIKIVLDDGMDKEEVILDSSNKGLVLEPGLWRDMIWLEDASILCVMASEYYDEADYIRDYKEFLEYKGIENVEEI